MIGPPVNTRIWVAAGFTDMRCGFDGLAAKLQRMQFGRKSERMYPSAHPVLNARKPGAKV